MCICAERAARMMHWVSKTEEASVYCALYGSDAYSCVCGQCGWMGFWGCCAHFVLFMGKSKYSIRLWGDGGGMLSEKILCGLKSNVN